MKHTQTAHLIFRGIPPVLYQKIEMMPKEQAPASFSSGLVFPYLVKNSLPDHENVTISKSQSLPTGVFVGKLLLFHRKSTMTDAPSNEVARLESCLKGDTRAFEAVVSQYQSLVCAITYSATGNSGHSEELAQDVFLKAWKNLDQLQDLTKFRGWLCRIARTTVQNRFRSQQRDTAAQAAPLDAANHTTSIQPTPEEISIHREQEALVSQILSELPDAQRLVLVLYYREHLSIAEVARQLEISEEATRQRISRSRKLIRTKMHSILETTLSHSRPGKAFTAGVITSIATLSLPADVAYATSAQAASAAGSPIAVTSVFSGLTAKVCGLAAGLIIIAGAVMIHKNSQSSSDLQEPESYSQTELQADVTPAVSQETELGPAIQETIEHVPVPSATPEPTELPSVSTTAQPGAAIDANGFEPMGVLSGLVICRQTGDPIPNVQVSDNRSEWHDTKTDIHGFYSVPQINQPGKFKARLYAYPNHVISTWPMLETTLELDPNLQAVKHFEMDQACKVAITVLDANGVGIRGAKLSATSLAGQRHETVADLVQHSTDSEGYHLYGGFPPSQSEYLITVMGTSPDDPEGQILAPAHATVKLSDPGEIKTITIVQEGGQDVYGYAEYADGIAATDIQIRYTPSWWHLNHYAHHAPTNVNEDGTFRLGQIVPGMYDISVMYPHMGGFQPVLSGIDLPAKNGEPIDLALPENSVGSSVSISGSLQIVGGEYPSSVEINVLSLETHKQNTIRLLLETDRESPTDFTITGLKPGDYLLYFFAGQLYEKKILQKVEAPSSNLFVEVSSLDISLPVLAGQVTDQGTQEPITQFKFRLIHDSHSSSPNRHEWIDVTNSQGQFQLKANSHGTYRIQVTADGYAPTWSDEFNSKESPPLQLSLSTGGSMSGKVISESGQLLTGATVTPLSLASGATSDTLSTFVSKTGATRTSNGRFILENLPPGAESLKITHPDYVMSIVEEIDIRKGENTEGIEIALGTGGAIEGIVYDNQGRAQANQTLHVRIATPYLDSLENALATAVTDSNGFYRIDGLPNLTCVVHRKFPWPKRLGVMIQRVVPKHGQVQYLDFGGIPQVHGTLLSDGSPMPNHTLLLGEPLAHHYGTYCSYTQSDELGRFSFQGVASGTYTLYYKHPTLEKQWIKLRTIDMAGNDLNLGAIQFANETVP